jgi:S-DNA-T family DNA segregation ATPase FtsK/SpoIIIE
MVQYLYYLRKGCVFMPRVKKNAKNEASTPALYREVWCLGVAAASVLLILAMYMPGGAGWLGRMVQGLLFGLFGFGGFVLPVAMLVVAVTLLISREIKLPHIKAGTLAWLVLALLHIVQRVPGPTGLAYFADVFSRAERFEGGVVGAILGEILFNIIGSAGSIVAIIAAIIILLVLISGKSFVAIMRRGAERAKDYYDEQAQRRLEQEDAEPAFPPHGQATIKKPQKMTEILDYNEDDDSEPHVLLVSEEIEERNRLRGAGNPLFQKRDERPNPLKMIPMPSPRGELLTFPEQPDEHPETDEPIPDGPFITEDFPEDGHVPVVRGLVDDAEKSDLPPLFDIEDDDPMAYDEYARAAAAKQEKPAPSFADYKLPAIDILNKNVSAGTSAESRTAILENSRILEETLRSFRIEAKVVEVSVGPTVTRYDLAPGAGVKVATIVNLSNDLALSLAAQGIRIEAPVPGKSAVGIEIPNKEPQGVFLREIIDTEPFKNFQSRLAFGVGKDIAGNPIIADIARMPHLLIAGATGSGKSVCINTLIASLLYRARPDEVKLLMIDPKVVELSVYNGIPHLLIPVVTEPKKASGALSWAVAEMEHRYNLFAEAGCRDLRGYNQFLAADGELELPQIVIIIDELADLMMAAKGEVEDSICRLAQKARAAGFHLIVATQRPSVDVITGLIKANIPSRLVFAVSSGIDSRTVIDMYGAEKLLGKGDMLFLPMGQNKPLRVQGAFISDSEVENLVAFLRTQATVEHTQEMIQQVTMPGKTENIDGEVDEFFFDAVDFLLVKGKGSTSMLQRQFRIGYNRASRLMEDLERRGIVGPEDGVKPRKVTITRQEFDEIYGQNN